jgi:hypothetical protein
MLFITGLPGFCPSSGNKGIDQRFGSRRIGRQLIVRDAPTLECRPLGSLKVRPKFLNYEPDKNATEANNTPGI